MDRPPSRDPRADLRLLDEAPTGELIKHALEDARELVRIEVGLAREEACAQVKLATRAAIAGGIALGAALLCLSTVTIALVLASGGSVTVALVIAGIYLLVACVAGRWAYRMMPKKAAGETRRRIGREIDKWKEHVA